MDLTEYLIFIGVVLGVNMLPAFGPPTGLLVVFFKIKYDLALVPLVVFGALAAATGRFLLASGARRFRDRFSDERIADLNALRDELAANKGAAFAGLALFALSPIPSAQLFMAAGVTGVPLVPFTLAFFAGRLVSYTIYGTAATLAQDTIDQVMSKGFSSPWSIALQLLMLVGVVALTLAPWRRIFKRWTAGRDAASLD